MKVGEGVQKEMANGQLLSWLVRLRSGIVFVEGWEVRRDTTYVETCVDVDEYGLILWDFVELVWFVFFIIFTK